MELKFRAPTFPAGCEDDQLWTIRQTVEAYGVTLRALRFYESRGLLAPIRNRTAKASVSRSIRVYDFRQRRMLEKILSAKKFGFTLAETRTLLVSATDPSASGTGLTILPDEAATRIALLEQQRDTLDRAIAD